MAIIVARVESDDLDTWYAEHMKAIPAFKETAQRSGCSKRWNARSS